MNLAERQETEVHYLCIAETLKKGNLLDIENFSTLFLKLDIPGTSLSTWIFRKNHIIIHLILRKIHTQWYNPMALDHNQLYAN